MRLTIEWENGVLKVACNRTVWRQKRILGFCLAKVLIKISLQKFGYRSLTRKLSKSENARKRSNRDISIWADFRINFFARNFQTEFQNFEILKWNPYFGTMLIFHKCSFKSSKMTAFSFIWLKLGLMWPQNLTDSVSADLWWHQTRNIWTDVQQQPSWTVDFLEINPHTPGRTRSFRWANESRSIFSRTWTALWTLLMSKMRSYVEP